MNNSEQIVIVFEIVEGEIVERKREIEELKNFNSY